LDSGIILSRSVYQEGRFPAVDILASTSSALNPDTVGQDHYDTAIEAQSLLKKAMSLDRIVSLIGESELSTEDQVTYKRAKMLKNYMTQSFTVVEVQTERKGVHIPIKDAVADVKAILAGKVDQLQPENLLFIGTLKDVEQLIPPSISVLSQQKPVQTPNTPQPDIPQKLPTIS
jgi:F-type H+-transporting ATPase subunit beta